MRHVGDVTVTLPAAPPELYLRGVEWWREAVRYAYSAAMLGHSSERVRGLDPARDLILHDGPDQTETLALRAIAEGIPEIAPTYVFDADVLADALKRGEALWDSIVKLLEFGGPALDPAVDELRIRARQQTERTLAGLAATS
jgi:hypothetical protein